jgi:hypothetical protein
MMAQRKETNSRLQARLETGVGYQPRPWLRKAKAVVAMARNSALQRPVANQTSEQITQQPITRFLAASIFHGLHQACERLLPPSPIHMREPAFLAPQGLNAGQ